MAITGMDTSQKDMGLVTGNPVIYNTPTPATYGTGPQTLLANDIIGGMIVSAGSAGAGTTALTLPTAASLAAALRALTGLGAGGVRVGDTLYCLIINGNSSSGNLVMTASAGVTFDANQSAASQVIGQNSSKDIAVRFTNGTVGSEAYTVYS